MFYKILCTAAVWLILSGSAFAQAFTHVQGNTSDSASADPQAITFTSNVTSGNLLMVAIGNKALSSMTVSSVTGSAGVCDGTWTQRVAHSGTSAVYIYSSVATGTGACTVTFDLGAAASTQEAAWEASFTGGETPAADTSCEGTTNPPATAHKCTTGATTTNADVYSVAFSICGTVCALSASPGGYTSLTNANQSTAQYRVLTGTGTFDAEWTSAVNEVTATVVAFMEATAAGGASPVPKLMLTGVGGQ